MKAIDNVPIYYACIYSFVSGRYVASPLFTKRQDSFSIHFTESLRRKFLSLQTQSKQTRSLLIFLVDINMSPREQLPFNMLPAPFTQIPEFMSFSPYILGEYKYVIKRTIAIQTLPSSYTQIPELPVIILYLSFIPNQMSSL